MKMLLHSVIARQVASKLSGSLALYIVCHSATFLSNPLRDKSAVLISRSSYWLFLVGGVGVVVVFVVGVGVGGVGVVLACFAYYLLSVSMLVIACFIS